MRPSITYVMLLAATPSAVLLFSWGLHPILPHAIRENTLIEHHNQASLANIYFCVSTHIYMYTCAYVSVHLYLHVHRFSFKHQKQDGMRGRPGNLGFGIIKGSATRKAMLSYAGPRFMGPLRAPIVFFVHTHPYIYMSLCTCRSPCYKKNLANCSCAR